MVGIVVVGHGRMAEALVTAAEGIVGPIERLATVDLLPGEGLEIGRGKVLEAIARADDGDGVVVLADLFGGTPSNCCVDLLDEGRLEMVTGLNLPMLLKAATSRAQARDPARLAAELAAYGRANVLHASEVLRARCRSEGADGGQEE
ncbi:MAG TPA: PTS sugar transporter subunit IIA [Vulgatibacter sp.]|nr:PTS sugar transporter subunit IIA [Vulgatibacter sp.]